MSQLPGQYPGPEERGPELPTQPPTYGDPQQPSQLPSPPTYSYQYAPNTPAQPAGPAQGRGGLLGWLGTIIAGAIALFKYAFFIVPYGKTLITLVISFGAYAIFFGPWFAAGLVVMILIHEFGHVIEINRQGLKATAPVFIPFFGAAIFQREHPQSALHQAQIGIAGPLLGTVGAVVAYVLYGTTHFTPLLLAAYLGFFINLFNLIPAGMLDGGWILGAVSKWFQVFGLALLALLVIFAGISPIIIVFVLLGLPTIFARFRNDRDPYYQAVPVTARWAMGGAWLVLAVFLGFASFQAHTQLLSYLG
jgi:Zn-dependent protease